MKVLVVDDSKAMRLIIGRIVKQLGHEVLEAGDGQEAITRVRDNQDLGLVMVDWNMPVMNGLDFLKTVRSDQTRASLPIIMVTTESELAQVKSALSAGASDYLMKPFTSDTMLEKLQAMGL